MSKSTTDRKSCHFTARAALVVIGQKVQQLDIFKPIEERGKIRQEMIYHTPAQKLLDSLISILAGGRGLVEANNRVQLNAELIPSQVLGSPVGALYQHLDADTWSGIDYYYWLEAVDVYSHTALYGPVSASLAPGGPGYRIFLPLMAK